MDSSGRIYQAPEEDIPQEDKDRLAKAMETAKEQGFTGFMSVGTSFPSPDFNPNVERCPQCFEELVAYDTGYGDSTRMGCPTHGFDRYPIVTLPRWLEADIRQHPELARSYVEWVIGDSEE